jgi:hypothetical protein
VPHSHCETTTCDARLRHTGMVAPMVIDRPVNRDAVTACVTPALVPERNAASMTSRATPCLAAKSRHATSWNLTDST